ncbi:DUF6491 family protein [Algimonas porphyrae]|uniref:Lipoprotein n=1 Tax=Algimonas porphyrae TaxID=1128113 RepID=A0ABQ5UXY0_9PROT|nr:DUF6491 family protein [Algimonas porphyrae]GLQ20141.1 hypothetical protein GCM10007854_10960 [Algimonas porphyrae]
MQNSFALIALSGLMLTWLAACATTDRPTRSETLAQLRDDPRTGEEVDRICFTRGIDSFKEESRYSVVLRRGVSDEYLVVTRSCPDLERAQSLAVNGSGSCLRRQDSIRVFTSAFGPSAGDTPGFNRCLIDRIYRWDGDAMDEKTMDEDATDDVSDIEGDG